MEQLIQQNPLLSPSSSNPSGTDVTNPISTPLSPPLSTSPIISTQFRPARSSETSEVLVYPSSVSLRVCMNKKFQEKKKNFFFPLSTSINPNV